MPLKYTRWYPRRLKYNRRTSPQKTRKIASSTSRAIRFLKTEFFSFNHTVFSKFSRIYGKKYGYKSQIELIQTYPHWKSGQTRMSGKTIKKILECVPLCLSKEAQFKLLCFQIPSVLHQQKLAMKIHHIEAWQLDETYQQIADRIMASKYTVEWFLKDLFLNGELNEFVNLFKFMLLDSLRQSFKQVQQDLTLMYKLLPTLDSGVDLQYRVNLFDCNLKIDFSRPPINKDFTISIPEPILVSQYRDKYQQMLMEHALSHRQSEIEGQVNHHLALTDIQNLVSQLGEITSHHEYDSSMTLQGSGGIMRLRLFSKNLMSLRFSIAKQAVKLIFTLGAFAIATGIMLNISTLIPFIIILGFITLYMVSSTFTKLRLLGLEAIEYERKHTKRFATFRL